MANPENSVRGVLTYYTEGSTNLPWETIGPKYSQGGSPSVFLRKPIATSWLVFFRWEGLDPGSTPPPTPPPRDQPIQSTEPMLHLTTAALDLIKAHYMCTLSLYMYNSFTLHIQLFHFTYTTLSHYMFNSFTFSHYKTLSHYMYNSFTLHVQLFHITCTTLSHYMYNSFTLLFQLFHITYVQLFHIFTLYNSFTVHV